MLSEGDRVIDDAGVEFTLGSVIAKGGQGKVFRVVGLPDHAIKLLARPEELGGLEAVRRLPLDGLAVAPPLTLIRTGDHGYVMRLAGEMTPLREPYLPTEFGPANTASWYGLTGGLRRRLALVARVADTLSALHGRGLAYLDLNPNNVMVSSDLSRDEAWLIDTDNLTSITQPISKILGFPGYIAPERMRRRPPTTLSDAYSLAALVFRLLVLEHPLKGVATLGLDAHTVNDGVNRGLYPYVAHPEDSTNRLSKGSLPGKLLELTLSGRLTSLCQRTFVDGLHEPTKRPGTARWRDVLHSALDNVLVCGSGCGWTYYRTSAACPNCGVAAGTVPLLTVYGGDFEQPTAGRDSLVLSAHAPTAVLPRQLWGTYGDREPVLIMTPDKKGFTVKASNDVALRDERGKAVKALRLPISGELARVRVTAPDRPDRLLTLRALEPR